MKIWHLLFLSTLVIPLALADPYRDAVLKTTGMVSDPDAAELARKFDLQVLNLTWEDTGRYKGSAVGPNISDMTIQVAVPQPGSDQRSIHCMPVIRHPNFSDKSADLDPRDFTLLVGNENGGALKRVSLRDFLESPTEYLHDPKSWGGKGPKSLLASNRDAMVLVSAQACFLPIPQEGKATFNPVLFNYQSIAGDPAVLTILATREGTSVTVIDNKRDAFSEGGAWGQRLFFNSNGQRASLTGERESEFLAKPENSAPSKGPEAGKGQAGLNMVLLIQVPLKQKTPPRKTMLAGVAETAAPAAANGGSRHSDVENAVIGHGDLEGPFTEIDKLAIERDDRFPVRVTVQFYKATSNGLVSENDLREIKAQIDRVYAQSNYVGSLVTGGETGRITEYDGAKIQPADWWEDFWKRHQKNTGDSKEEAIEKLKKLLGEDFMVRPATELYLNDVLKSNKVAATSSDSSGAETPAKKGMFSKLFGKEKS